MRPSAAGPRLRPGRGPHADTAGAGAAPPAPRMLRRRHTRARAAGSGPARIRRAGGGRTAGPTIGPPPPPGPAVVVAAGAVVVTVTGVVTVVVTVEVVGLLLLPELHPAASGLNAIAAAIPAATEIRRALRLPVTSKPISRGVGVVVPLPISSENQSVPAGRSAAPAGEASRVGRSWPRRVTVSPKDQRARSFSLAPSMASPVASRRLDCDLASSHSRPPR
ncbi:hypothetical protein L838_1007 [Mycobacterium avium MAV_120709_2344]|nr:hypothetical protein L838_1007 [Mycobacterium avium MAV_120709_2344]